MILCLWTKTKNGFAAIVNFFRLLWNINKNLPALKIIAQQPSKENNEIDFIIQVSGRNLFPKLSAAEIYNDKKLFNNFSMDDKKRIEVAYKDKTISPLVPANAQTISFIS